jgi:HSP20 family protein
MPNRTTDISSREQQSIARREPGRASHPFNALDRFADEMERVFDDFGLGGRGWMRPFRRSWAGADLSTSTMWAPDIDVSQRNNDLVVRADLPGMKKNDIHIDVTDDAITISGERHQEHETDREGVYRSERTYGSFFRTIALPEGAMTDQAKATFKDGVLEVTMPAPPRSARGRRLDITETSDQKK